MAGQPDRSRRKKEKSEIRSRFVMSHLMTINNLMTINSP